MAGKRDLVCLGALAGAWGVRGAVRLKSFCAEPGSIGDYNPLITEDGREMPIRIEKAIKGAFAAHISGITSKEAADALRGTRLYAPRDRLPDLSDDEFYHADLIGLSVFDTGGAQIGRIKAVMDHGAGDFLEIARPGMADLLVPFTQAAVPTVDLENGRVIIDPPTEMEED